MTNFFLILLFSIALLFISNIPEYKNDIIIMSVIHWLILLLYFAPTFVVCQNRDDKTLRGISLSDIIFMFFANLLFGWTILGWIICIIAALNMGEKKKEFKKVKDLTLKELEELKASLKENKVS